MKKRTLLRFYIAIVLVAVAVPVYVRLLFGRDQHVDWFTSVCERSMFPAFYLAPFVLPERSFSPWEIYPPGYDTQVYFCVVTAINVLFWSSVGTVVLLVVHLVRTRHISPPASNQAMEALNQG